MKHSSGPLILSLGISKMAFVLWVIPQIVAWLAVIQLMVWQTYYSLIGCLLLAISCYTFKQWKQHYRINPIVKLEQRFFANALFWEITFKEGEIQKIELLQYYRTAFLIIFLYKPLYSPLKKPCLYLLFYDALSRLQFRQLTCVLYSPSR